jgi:hypothetical protein
MRENIFAWNLWFRRPAAFERQLVCRTHERERSFWRTPMLSWLACAPKLVCCGDGEVYHNPKYCPTLFAE